MQLAPGTKLGPYEILSPLGAGGMGEVYRARDTRLGRDVAVKSLPAEFAQDPERLARFEREAKLLASLSHSNIAGIFGLEEAGGTRFLVLEFVEGETLAARLARGPLSIDDALAVCMQVATAVEAAHEAGIIHRDLKPGNVMLKPDGTVKVLDFGLARAGDDPGTASNPSLTASPTLTYAGTSAGVILGTAAYMSPEQARGRHVDRRTDIWSFGCVLWECLTGRQLFAGETVSDIIARILQTAPDWSELPAGTPPSVRGMLERCLTRDAKQRLRDIGEARIALASPVDEPAPPGARAPRRGVPLPFAIGAACVLALAAAGLTWVMRPAGPKPPQRVFDLVAKWTYGYDTGWYVTPQLSPDGSRIAYLAGNQVWVRDLDRLEPRAVADFDGDTPLAWSADGQAIAYESRKKLWRVSADGGSPVAITDIPETGSTVGLAWRADGTIVMAVWRGGLYQVSATSGKTSLLLAPESATQVDFHFPAFLQDGSVLCAVHWKSAQDSSGKHRAFLQVIREGRAIAVESDMIVSPGWIGYRDGMLLLCMESQPGLYAVGFDPGAARLEGDPALIVPGVSSFSLARDGSLLYLESASIDRASELGRIDRTGAWQGAIGEPRTGLGAPALSPDGSRVAFSAGAFEDRQIWIHDMQRNTDTRLTFEPGTNDSPRWVGNDRILYAWLPEGMSMNSRVVLRSADGSGKPVSVSSESGVGTGMPAIDVSPGLDQFLLIVDAAGRGELRLFDINDDRSPAEPRRVLSGEPEPNVIDMRLSPDGKLLAYVMDETGQPEVFLTRFPSGDGKWQASVDGGRLPRWDAGSRRLYYVAGSGPSQRSMVSVDVDPAVAVPVGARQTLFGIGRDMVQSRGFDAGYEVEPEGKGFLVVRAAGGAEDAPARMILVQNWRPTLDEMRGR